MGAAAGGISCLSVCLSAMWKEGRKKSFKEKIGGPGRERERPEVWRGRDGWGVRGGVVPVEVVVVVVVSLAVGLPLQTAEGAVVTLGTQWV